MLSFKRTGEIKRYAILCGFVGWICSSLSCFSVNLAWNSQPDAIGFKLYYGTNTFTQIPINLSGIQVTNVGPVTSCTVYIGNTNLAYYFSVTAYNSFGESDFSNEVIWNPIINVVTNQPPVIGIRWPNHLSSPVVYWKSSTNINCLDTLEYTVNFKDWITIPSSFYTLRTNEYQVGISTAKMPLRIFRVNRLCP